MKNMLEIFSCSDFLCYIQGAQFYLFIITLPFYLMVVFILISSKDYQKAIYRLFVSSSFADFYFLTRPAIDLILRAILSTAIKTQDLLVDNNGNASLAFESRSASGRPFDCTQSLHCNCAPTKASNSTVMSSVHFSGRRRSLKDFFQSLSSKYRISSIIALPKI